MRRNTRLKTPTPTPSLKSDAQKRVFELGGKWRPARADFNARAWCDCSGWGAPVCISCSRLWGTTGNTRRYATARCSATIYRLGWAKWNESGFRPPLCTYKLNWARRTSWGWWDDWDDTVLQTQDSKFGPWRSEAETGNRTPNSGVKGSGANHYPRAPAPGMSSLTLLMLKWISRLSDTETQMIWQWYRHRHPYLMPHTPKMLVYRREDNSDDPRGPEDPQTGIRLENVSYRQKSRPEPL